MENPQIIYTWKAPLRPFKKRSVLILRFYIAVALLLSLIVFFFGDRILLVPIWALLFLFYSLTITPPPEVENKITRFGIESAGVTMRWDTLSHFYFGSRFGLDTLTVVGRAPYFYHAYMVIPTKDIKKDVVSLLSEHLIYQEKPNKTVTDKMVDWLSSLVPEETSQEAPQASSSKPQPASP